MNKALVTGLLLASAMTLAACGQNNAGTSNKATNSSATAPASGNSQAAPAEGNSSGAAAGGGESADSTNQNFTIRNNTGQTINELYVSAVTTDDWEEDILGRDTLPNGETAQISFAREETQCNWDIRVVFENGQSLEERGVNLCQTGEIEVAP